MCIRTYELDVNILYSIVVLKRTDFMINIIKKSDGYYFIHEFFFLIVSSAGCVD